MAGGCCYILEGTWWGPRELPQVLPYFRALAATQAKITLAHRTIRSADDVAYWVKKIGKNSRSFLYFACHGDMMDLLPDGRRSRICREDLLGALGEAKEGAVSFLHFGCCEMIAPQQRRNSLQQFANVTGAHWVSGYTRSVDWLRSMFLDLALVSDVYLPFAKAGNRRGPKLKSQARQFITDYEQLARALGFSGLSSRAVMGRDPLFPARLRRGG